MNRQNKRVAQRVSWVEETSRNSVHAMRRKANKARRQWAKNEIRKALKEE